MKHVGIISLYYDNYNYGGQLQAFALQHVLEGMGFSSEQIRFKRDSYTMLLWKDFTHSSNVKCKARKFISLAHLIFKNILGFIRSIPINANLDKRSASFSNFELLIPHSDQIYDGDLSSANSRYDIFICGSDVIWNAGVSPEISALGFVSKDKKKLSYAPSLGTGHIPNGWFENYSPYLKQLSAISVREKSIADELSERLTDRCIETVVDPTLLMPADAWKSLFTHRHQQQHSKYIFCYLLGDSVMQRKRITDLAQKLNLKLLTFPHVTNNTFKKCDKNFGDIQDYSSDAIDFIGLIHDAELVITDSFHAIVFSTLFHKRFIALNRVNGRSTSMSGRVSNYLKSISLENQMVSNDLDNLSSFYHDIDYSKVDMCINRLRNESLSFLTDNVF